MCNNCAKFCVFSLCIVLAVSSEATTNNSSGNCVQKQSWTVYLDFAAEAIGKAKSSSVTLYDTAGKCGQREALMSYLEVAGEMINKAKVNIPTCNGSTLPQHRDIHTSCNNPDCSDSTNISKDPENSAGGGNALSKHTDSHLNSLIVDCSDLLRMDHRSSGVYTISPRKTLIGKETFHVYCDMETDGGGWTVIQRRGDFKNPLDYFFKDWNSYKEGFGDLNKEFWLGNDNIFTLTNQEAYSARFDLVDYENRTAYALYDVFRIYNESSKYTLHIAGYSGNAGDCMRPYHHNQKFSTRDQDNTEVKDNSAQMCVGAWWFRNSDKHCAHLNGENIKVTNQDKGKVWWSWKGYYESLERTEIKIRPMKVGF